MAAFCFVCLLVLFVCCCCCFSFVYLFSFLLLLCVSQDVDAIFYNLTELHELSIKLLGDLDECIEMSGEIGGNSNVPQVGVIFEDIAEVII